MTGPLPVAPEWVARLDLDQYHRMIASGVFDEDAPLELLYGVLTRMSPQGPAHANAVEDLDHLLQALLLGTEYRVRVQLPLTFEALAAEPEPDLAVTRAQDRPPTGHPVHAVLVIEVADDSLEKDRSTKLALYARARIPEYWIVNLRDDQLEVFRDPDPGTGTYRARSIHRSGETIESTELPGVSIPLAELF